MKHTLIILILLLADFAMGQQTTSGDITVNLNNKLIIYYIERPNIQTQRYRLDASNLITENFNGNSQFHVGYELARSLINETTSGGDVKFQSDILNIIRSCDLPVALFLVNEQSILTEETKIRTKLNLIPFCFDEKGYLKGCYFFLNPQVSFSIIIGSRKINDLGLEESKKKILDLIRHASNQRTYNLAAHGTNTSNDTIESTTGIHSVGHLEDGDFPRTFRTVINASTTANEIHSRLVSWIAQHVERQRAEELFQPNNTSVTDCFNRAQPLLQSASNGSFEIEYRILFHQMNNRVESINIRCPQVDQFTGTTGSHSTTTSNASEPNGEVNAHNFPVESHETPEHPILEGIDHVATVVHVVSDVASFFNEESIVWSFAAEGAGAIAMSVGVIIGEIEMFMNIEDQIQFNHDRLKAVGVYFAYQELSAMLANHETNAAVLLQPYNFKQRVYNNHTAAINTNYRVSFSHSDDNFRSMVEDGIVVTGQQVGGLIAHAIRDFRKWKQDRNLTEPTQEEILELKETVVRKFVDSMAARVIPHFGQYHITN